MDLTPELLRSLLDYDPETGGLTWRRRGVERFTTESIRSAANVAAVWNSRYAGKPAGHISDTGYLVVIIQGRPVKGHRVAWAVAYGEWPSEQIDHINGNKADNRLANLRAVSVAENMKNRPLQRNSTSGVSGVNFYRKTGKWNARIKVGGRRIELGHYETIDEAIAAREEAERKYGFHENHGRAA